VPGTKARRASAPAPPANNGSAGEVLTLAEAAAYLRLPELELVRLVREQGLPGRRVGTEWRFFRTAVQQWLSQPLALTKPEGIWAAAGSWKEDPYLDELLKQVYRRRGRPMTEEG
jgi:excisionase family DNA binding protein